MAGEFSSSKASQGVPLLPVALTPGATVAIDASLGDYFTLVPAQAFQFLNPTNPSHGQRILVRIKQDATGGRVVTFDTKYRFGTDLPLASVILSTSGGKVDYLGFVYDLTDDKWDVVSMIRGF